MPASVQSGSSSARRLPAELRNLIYSKATTDYHLPSEQPYGRANLAALWDFPVNNIQLANKKFRDEYLADVDRSTAISVRYKNWCARPQRQPSAGLKARLQNVKEMTILFATNAHLDAQEFLVRRHAGFRNDVASLLNDLPSLKKIKIQLEASTDEFQDFLEDGYPLKMEVLLQAYFPTLSQNQNVQIETEYWLTSRLWSPYSEFEIWDPCFAAESNRILYRGKVSDAPHTWNGLELEVMRAGEFSEDALQEERDELEYYLENGTDDDEMTPNPIWS